MARRIEQRERTRLALVEAAGEVLASGRTDPTMDEIASAAGMSRATAYRYFDSAADAVWQVFADQGVPDVDSVMTAAGGDVVDRVLAAEAANNDYLFDDPDGTRAFERAMLDRRLAGRAHDDDRPARRLTAIDAALAPIADRLTPADLRRTRHALALAIGSQTVPAMLDTCRLDVESAREATRFACRAIATEAVRRAEGSAHPA